MKHDMPGMDQSMGSGGQKGGHESMGHEAAPDPHAQHRMGSAARRTRRGLIPDQTLRRSITPRRIDQILQEVFHKAADAISKKDPQAHGRYGALQRIGYGTVTERTWLGTARQSTTSKRILATAVFKRRLYL